MESTIQTLGVRRQAISALVACLVLSALAASTSAQQPTGIRIPGAGLSPSDDRPQLRHLTVPPAHARSIANMLSMRYRDLPGITITQAANQEQIVVMAAGQCPSRDRAGSSIDCRRCAAERASCSCRSPAISNAEHHVARIRTRLEAGNGK